MFFGYGTRIAFVAGMDASKPEIYLAEDETDLLESLKLAFRIVGYSVVAHSNGMRAKEALETLESGKNFVLVSDILMPGLGGVDLIRFSKEKFPHCPAIAITGHGDKPMVMELLRCGCDDFLDKPFAPDELLLIVEQAIVLQKKRDEDTLVRLRAVDTIRRELQPMLETYQRGAEASGVDGGAKAVTSGGQKQSWVEGPEGIRISSGEGVAKVNPGGDWVGKRSECLREKLEELLTDGVRNIELLFNEVHDLDALALGVLCSLSHELREGGGSLSLRGVVPSVRGLFQHMKLDKEFCFLS